jgi:hypothetical protein
MSTASGEYATGLDLAAIDHAARAMGPGVRVVAPRVLWRVLAKVWGLGPLDWRMPRLPSYEADRGAVLAVVEPDELGLARGEVPPESLVLISRAELEGMVGRPASLALHGLWRLLLQARVRHQMETAALAKERVSDAEMRSRIEGLGAMEFDEVRAVLYEEGRLPNDASDRAIYTEFAAVYLDFRHLAPDRFQAVFPGIVDFAPVDKVLAADLDAARLLRETRPPGAADLDPGPRPWEGEPADTPEADVAPGPEKVPDDDRSRGLLDRAARVSAAGNVVRAAILRWRAAEVGPPRSAERRRAEARTELNRLARRLRAALDLDESRASAWRRTLYALIAPASRGPWPFEARLLYDLQKVCIDHERNIYATSLVGWVASLGRRPLTRLLPNQREILMVKHLRSALARLLRVAIGEAHRERAFGLFQEAIEHAEHRLRARFRPLIARALERADIAPANLPERVSLDASVEELLDRLVEFGQLTMGDVRDALSRGDVKLPDLSNPYELVVGDRLLQADRDLAVSLDGVYRPGEVYLRLLQRASAISFGTRIGRVLTKYVVLPFGGAYGALVAVQELFGIGLKGAARVERWLHGQVSWVDATEPEFVGPVSVLVLGAFLFGLIHSAAFRAGVAGLLRLLFAPARAALVELPAWVLSRPSVREVLLGRPFALALRYGLKPLLAGLAVVSAFRGLGDRGASLLVAGGLAAVVAALLLGTRVVREAEERLYDDTARLWRHLIDDFLPGLFRWIMDFFTRVLEQTERVLYSVDEWLRFRSGQSRLTLVFKALLGSIWAIIHYLVRIYVNLMFEPTVNPIKHFPTVTVAAKLLLPLAPTLSGVVVGAVAPFVGKYLAWGVSGLTLFFLPGIAGFLAWELKENWKLYEANRPPFLRPRVIGSHGEDMVHLLRPGVHSGTIPKLFRRLRHVAMRPSSDVRRRREQRRLTPKLRHVEEALAHFVEHHMLSLLRSSRAWGGRPIAVGHVRPATNRVRVELAGPPGSLPVGLAFDLQGRRLLGSIEHLSWLTALDPTRRRAFEAALAGIYARSGVQLVREWLDKALGDQPYKVTEEGLMVRPEGGRDGDVAYDLDETPVMTPRSAGPVPPPNCPNLEAAAVRFDASPISWAAWVELWDEDWARQDEPVSRWVAPRSLISG